MAEQVQFDLVSPEKRLMSDAVDMVVVPGGDGYFGVLPGHSPLISTLQPGVIDVHVDGKLRDRLYVGGGFAEVNAAGCTVLAQEAMPIADLAADRPAVEQALKNAEEDIGLAKDDAARRHAETRRDALAAKLQVLDLYG